MKANRIFLILNIAITGLFFSGAVAMSQQTEGQLYEKALYLEEAKGALQDAIDIYNQIAENKNADQSFQAKALLHMGLCYEKLGKQEAVKSYQRLVDNFPTYKNEVAIARERLTQLLIAENNTKKPITPEFTRIEIPTKPGNGVLSPDGKKLAYISEKSLWVVPVHGKTNPNIAGEPVRLTEPMDAWDLANMCTVWSADGKWLALYVTENREDVIYIVPADRGKPVKVPLNQNRPDIGGYDYRMSLSPDGNMLAFVNRDDNKNSFIYTTSVNGGTPRKLTGPGTREPAFSPDGKFIAYVKLKPKSNLGDEIWVIPSTGGISVLISDKADVVKSPVWSPDGSMIAFLARKYEEGWANNSNELWIAALDSNVKPTGLITKTELSNSTTSMLAGWSPDNKIGIWLSKPEKNLLYTVPATGGQAMQVTTKNSWMPCWSSDGKFLYFDGINTDNFAGLESVPASGGDVQRIPIRFKETIQPEMPVGGISVSPDGKKIVFETYYKNVNDSMIQKNPDGFHHIVTVSLNGGILVELTTNSLPDGYPVWSPDGRHIAFLRKIEKEDKTEGEVNLYTIPSEGGNPKKVSSVNDKVTFGRIDWSPDGKWIGFFSNDSTIKIIPSEGGNSKVLVKDVDVHPHFGLSFSPEGDKIAYSYKENLYEVDLNTGISEEIRTGLDAIPTMPAWSPDGGKIAFSAYQKEETDLWFMEGFLPLEKSNYIVKKEKIKPLFTKINIPSELSWNAATSPDGQELLMVYDEKLWKIPLSGNLGPDVAGKPVQLNTGSIKVIWAGLSWSADGKSIAFNEDNPLWLKDIPENEKRNQTIYVIPSTGGISGKILENYCGPRAVSYRISLSPDGSTLAYSSVDSDKMHIYIIPVKGGVPRKLVESEAREPVFSPQGNLIAYVEDKEVGIKGGGLWTVPTSGGDPILVAEAGNASSPVWSPDGRKITFLDDDEQNKINIISVDKEGRPVGKKVTIDAPEGTKEVTLLTGWSKNNKIGMIVSRVKYGLYTMPADGGQAVMIFNGNATQPRWSPDNKRIFFRRDTNQRVQGWLNSILAVVPADGGEDHDIFSTYDDKIGIFPYGMGLRITPDGQSIVFSGKKIDADTVYINNFPTRQIWSVSKEGRGLTKITDPPVPYSDDSPCVSPDGKTIAFIRTELQNSRMNTSGESGIYIINSSGGEPKLILSEPENFIYSINWSPDGKNIAYLKSDNRFAGSGTMNVFDFDNGASRKVGEVPWFSVHTELAWSPDSKKIAFNDKEGKVIKVMSVEDGSIKDIETGLVDAKIFHLDWSPDGERFVFVGYQDGVPEFWFLEDFLPLVIK